MVAQCNLDQWEALEKKLHPEAELLCSLHFGAPYPEKRILQAIFNATPFYNSYTAQYSRRISVQPQSDSILHLLATRSLSIHLSACLPQLPCCRFLSHPLLFSLPFSISSSQQHVAEIRVFGTTDMLSTLKVQSYTPDIVLSDVVWSDEDPTLLLMSVYPTSHFLDHVPSIASITLSTNLSPQKHFVLVTRVMDNLESVNNTMLSLTQTVRAVLTPSTNAEDDKRRHFYLWLAPSLATPKVLQKKTVALEY
ncbi:uncharacterized protein LOC109069001 [Cyprinus carpio]|uniref:Uncharacterized protein LOC109069001 n=1 Tax=Cyprinus carpio TaxID=7962 RepID=A0A9R0BAE2_CYPCA|nr:uncharacterized protein LOC109069001 [Cyprinus carpio]